MLMRTDLFSVRVDLSLERTGKVLTDSVGCGGKILQDDLNGSELSVVERGVVAARE